MDLASFSLSLSVMNLATCERKQQLKTTLIYFMKYQGIYASYRLILHFFNDAVSTTKILGVKTNFGGHVQMEIKHEDSNNRSFIIAL
jgi:hypothetical protein